MHSSSKKEMVCILLPKWFWPDLDLEQKETIEAIEVMVIYQLMKK